MRLHHPCRQIRTSALSVAHEQNVSVGRLSHAENLHRSAIQRMESILNNHALGVIPGIMWLD
ncbi:MAG: hypothetical protein ACRD6B_02755, partial [Bryobacteraceae bacterium]